MRPYRGGMNPRRRSFLLSGLRYGLPVALIVAGFVILVVVEGSERWDGWAMCVGAGLSVAFMNVVFRIGAKGDEERQTEDAARAYYTEHGYWPGEEPPDRRGG